jgi:hypothetical protein
VKDDFLIEKIGTIEGTSNTSDFQGQMEINTRKCWGNIEAVLGKRSCSEENDAKSAKIETPKHLPGQSRVQLFWLTTSSD